MKLSESFAQSIMDAVQSECSIGEVQALLNELLRAKVAQTNIYEQTYDDMCINPNGEYVIVDELLADN